MMTVQLHRARQDDGAMAGARARKPNRVQPPRSCDQCGRPQSIYRNQHETRCASCQIKTPPSDWRRLRESEESPLGVRPATAPAALVDPRGSVAHYLSATPGRRAWLRAKFPGRFDDVESVA